MVYGGGPGHGANIKEDRDIKLEEWPKGIEEPLV